MGKKTVVQDIPGQQVIDFETLTEQTTTDQEAQQKLVDFLQLNCMEVGLEVGWFSTSKKLDDDTVQEMLKDYDATVDSVGMTKHLFSSKHPAIKTANAAKTALTRAFYAQTIPAAAVPPAMVTVKEARKFLAKAPGTRYIQKERLDPFMEQIMALIASLKSAVTAVNEQLQDIIAFDKGRLGKLYRQGDHPKTVAAEVRWTVNPIQYPVDFEQLAPKTCAFMKKQFFDRMGATIDVAAVSIADNLAITAKQIAAQLGNRTRLLVPLGHELQKLRGAEVVQKLTHEDSPDEIAEGQVLFSARYKPASKDRNIIEWFGPMTEAAFDSLKPYSTDEKKKVAESSLRNLREQCTAFRQVGEMLGAKGQKIAAAVTSLEDMLAAGGGNDEAVVKEMRDSAYYRKQLAPGLLAVAEGLETVVKQINPRERKIVRLKRASSEADDD